MAKRVIFAGLLGGGVLILWTFLVNGILGFQSSINLNRLPEESKVYELLKTTVVEPGHYVVNPEGDPVRGYPRGEPVFGLTYSGFGHEAAGRLAVRDLVTAFLSTMLAAALLSMTSRKVLSSWPRKVLFFVGIGLLFAVVHDLQAHGIGGYPLRDALLLATNDIVGWTVVGSTVAWWMRSDAAVPRGMGAR